MRLIQRIGTWVRSYPIDLWLVGLGSFINITGLSLLWPINAIYIHTKLGQSMTVAGLVLMLYSGSGFIGSFLSGWLYDRIGIIPVLLVGLGASAATISVPAFHHGFTVYIVVMAIFGMTSAMPFPALTTMAGQAWPTGGRKPFNFIYVTNNLGVAAGTALGGVLAELSFTTVFSGIAAAYLLFLLLVLTVFRRRFGKYRRSRATSSSTGLGALPAHLLPRVPWLAVLILLLGFILSWVVYVQWQSTVSVYMQQLGYPLTSYSVLWTLNGLLIFLAQPVVTLVTRRVRELPSQMLLGVVLYMAAMAVLVATHRYYGFVLAMVVTTFGEMFVWPAVPAAMAQMAPVHRAGLLQGIAGSSATLGRMLGPVVGGFLFDRVTEHVALIIFCVFLVVPLLFFVVYGRLDKAVDSPRAH